MASWKRGIDLKGVKRVPFREIPRKVSVDRFARPMGSDREIAGFFPSLPSILAAADFRGLLERIREARRGDRPVVAMIGGHVIKCGVSPILIDLMKRKIVTAIAMNGAAAIHDFEIALFGETSEEVEGGLAKGIFGMSEETGSGLNRLVREAADRGLGLGEAIGGFLVSEDAPHTDFSLLAAASRLDLPATVHVAIGTDVIHQHPDCDGGALGATSYEDFRRFCGVVTGLEGGVILNLGSAVILPEVFLKALCVARNLGGDIADFTAADFDMIRHYRPSKNVVERPTGGKGTGYHFTGHHEIMIPLLAAGLLEGSLDNGGNRG